MYSFTNEKEFHAIRRGRASSGANSKRIIVTCLLLIGCNAKIEEAVLPARIDGKAVQIYY